MGKPTALQRVRKENDELKAKLLLLAKMALPNHPRGGFFNPLVAMEVRQLAESVLNEVNYPPRSSESPSL